MNSTVPDSNGRWVASPVTTPQKSDSDSREFRAHALVKEMEIEQASLGDLDHLSQIDSEISVGMLERKIRETEVPTV